MKYTGLLQVKEMAKNIKDPLGSRKNWILKIRGRKEVWKASQRHLCIMKSILNADDTHIYHLITSKHVAIFGRRLVLADPFVTTAISAPPVQIQYSSC